MESVSEQSRVALVLMAAVPGLLFLMLRRRLFSNSVYPLPPGPPGSFLVGNLGQVSLDHPAQDYMRWGDEYNSDVIHLKVLGQHMICLNSVEAATDLLDKRGYNYCDRPRFTLFEVMGWGLTLTFLRWGPRFKLHRALFQKAFTQSNVKRYRPIQLQEARKAVRLLLANPQEWEDVTLLMATSIIFRISYGQEVQSIDSAYCDMSAAANDATTNGGVPGSTLADIFPPARFLPDWMNVSDALRHARRSRPTIQTIHEVPWAAAMRDIEAGTAEQSFMKTQLEKLWEDKEAGVEQELRLDDIKGAAGAIFIAGGNTTWSTVLSVLLFLTKYPLAQQKLHAELDAAVTGLPTFTDRLRLPNLDNFLQEVLRLLPLNPLVIPHKSLAEDVYRGMRIPAGSVVFANAKAMSIDPRQYRDPEVFDPGRYARGEPPPPGNFGFGRRKCPGNFLAMASVWIFIATLLKIFEIRMVEENGKVLEPAVGLRIGLGGHPLPFRCNLKVRSAEAAELLMKEQEQ